MMQVSDRFCGQSFDLTSAAMRCPFDDVLPSMPLHATTLQFKHASNLCAQLTCHCARPVLHAQILLL